MSTIHKQGLLAFSGLLVLMAVAPNAVMAKQYQYQLRSNGAIQGYLCSNGTSALNGCGLSNDDLRSEKSKVVAEPLKDDPVNITRYNPDLNLNVTIGDSYHFNLN